MTSNPDTDYNSCLSSIDSTDTNDVLKCFSQVFHESQAKLTQSTIIFFLVYAASLVFFMQAGFAMLCAGSVRKKNVQNTILKNFLDACGAALGFYSVGYAFAFGGKGDHKTFIGNSKFFLMNTVDDGDDGSEYAKWLFQFAFAATATTIVAGTLAERCQMRAYLVYSVALTGFVYPVVVHSIWSTQGFLSHFAKYPFLDVGMVDFAGSGVVHLTGGATALIATKIVGPRKGRFHDDAGVKLENPVPFPGHSKPLQMLGTLILWFGWYGFNAGSAIDPTSSHFNTRAVSTAVVNTTLAGAAGGVSALFMNYFLEERKTGEPVYNLLYGMNGSIAGLVSITAGCAVVQPWAALVIGIIAGWIYLGSSFIMEKYCIDDAVDAIPVHFANGIWGCIAVGLFASPRGLLNLTDNAVHYGLFYSWGQGSSDARLLACQIIGVIFIMSWITVIMTPFFFILNYSGWLRADSLEEFVGLDVSYHGSTDFLGVDPEYVSIMNRRRDARRSRHSLHSGDADKVEDGGVDVIQ